MHKSRLACLVIDCKDTDLERHETFWASALGRSREKGTKNPKYRDLQGPAGEIQVLLQSVEHEPRVHIDIETDNVPAEVARLKELGAVEVGTCKSWVVMQAPSGHRFCVVELQRSDFQENANVWPDQRGR